MNVPVSRHPGAETMAAFLEGKLAPESVAAVAAHLRECEDCRTITGEAARFEEEEAQFHAAARRPAKSRWWMAVAAAAASVVIAIPLLRPSDPIATLIDASPRDHRRVQGRLSGFPWAPLHGARRSQAASPAEHELTSAAHEVLGRTTDDEAVEARHAAGVANLLIDQTAAGLEKLASAAGDSKDARIWNDLAAARFTVAVREGDEAALLPPALAAADRAIQLDPELADAHFNRALILEQMNARDAARQAWERYLALDPSSAWSAEARQRLRRLGAPSSGLDFKNELARAAGRRDRVAALVRRFPQESRLSAEGPLLAEWAAAHLAKDAARADEKLGLIRTIGEELAATKGERLLLDTVDAIANRDAFAHACNIFYEARLALRKRDLATAEEGLLRAADAFRAVRSPLADVASFFAAQCAFDRNRPAESTAALHALRARVHPSHRALAAEIDRGIARNANAAADWGTAAQFAARASATFAELGENAGTAIPTAIEVFALEKMGATGVAWRRRLDAIAALSHDRHGVASILHSAALALNAADQCESASAVMDVAIETESHAPEPSAMRTVYLTERARMAERMGDAAAARRWLGDARAALGHVGDASLRRSFEAQIELAEAVLRRGSDPRGAIAALDAVIAFYEDTGVALRLPDAYLQRARAHRAAGRDEDALADYAAVLKKIDAQQRSANRETLSVEFLDVAAQTVDETAELHLARGEVEEAFAVVDRAHAMAPEGYRRANVPPGTVLIEYAILPRSLVIFCVTSEGITAEKVAIGRGRLAARVEGFVRKIQRRRELLGDARTLHALLIAPVATRIAGARELVIVPDRQLSMLPFAALHDGRTYLIERYALRVAPSAAADARPAADAAAQAVVIADPATRRALPLPFSRGEAKDIAAIHGAETVIGAAATRARVVDALASSALVHYAGHANSDLASYGALLLAPSPGDSDLLTAADVARLELRARPLVVLSACGTLRGETTHIAGMPSLARAFLGAGARAVVGTLWEVDDDVASELFLRFHQRLHAGEVPAGALRTAQIAMLQTSDARRRHPSSWSAVEVLSNL